MINIAELKTKDDLLRLENNDNILIKYKSGQIYHLKIEKVEGNQLVTKPNPCNIQEVYINIDGLIDRDLDFCIDCVVKIN